jgi:bacterioferritin
MSSSTTRQPAPSAQPFLTDVRTLRQRARQHIEEGAVTSNYGADPEQVCRVLNEALA